MRVDNCLGKLFFFFYKKALQFRDKATSKLSGHVMTEKQHDSAGALAFSRSSLDWTMNSALRHSINI